MDGMKDDDGHTLKTGFCRPCGTDFPEGHPMCRRCFVLTGPAHIEKDQIGSLCGGCNRELLKPVTNTLEATERRLRER